MKHSEKEFLYEETLRLAKDFTSEEISQKTGLSVVRVLRIIKSQGFQAKRKKRTYNDQTYEILKDLNSGDLRQSDIARKYGVSRQYVSQVKKRQEK